MNYCRRDSVEKILRGVASDNHLVIELIYEPLYGRETRLEEFTCFIFEQICDRLF